MNTNTDPVWALLVPKLDMIISGYRINQDDADWLRGLLHRASAPPSAPVGVGGLPGLPCGVAVVTAKPGCAGTSAHVRVPQEEGTQLYSPQQVRDLMQQVAALAQQPAAPSGEAVAYRWRDRGTMQMVYSSTNPGYCNVAPLYAAPQQVAGVDGMVMVQASDLKTLAEFADRGMRGNPAKLAALRAKAILAQYATQQQGGRADG